MNWKRLSAMIVKEFSQLFHDRPILFILVFAFTGIIYLAGHAISMDIKNYPVVVHDLSQSKDSRELISHLRSPYFKVVRYVYNDRQTVKALDSGKASLAVIIPPEFARNLRQNKADFQVISDGTLTMSAAIANAYIANILNAYNLSILKERGVFKVATLKQLPQVDARVRVAYNPNFTHSWFSSLLELFNMITMISTLLTAAAMVREKEHGTLEQLMITPLRPVELFIAKIVPTVVMVSLFSLISLLGVINGIYGTPLRGNFLFFYIVSAVYIFIMSGLGLTIAIFARNIAQATLMMLLIIFPMMFLSGSFTPPESMSTWMRYASLLSPMRYYIDFGFQVLFKGNGFIYVWHDIAGIMIFGIIIFGISLRYFKHLYNSVA